MAATIRVTMITMMTALAAAGGYCSAATSFCRAETTDALWPPLMVRTTKESPITRVTTKIDPSAMPVRDSGHTTSATTRKRPAPASRAASSRLLSMRAMELKIGTTMNSVNRWT